jgi:hypothetical protein
MKTKHHLALAALAVTLGLGAAFLVFRQSSPPRLAATSPGTRQEPQPSTGSPASTPRAPTFVNSGISNADTDEATPGSPSYRPQKFLQSVGLKGIFEREARDEPWATPVEKQLGDLVTKDVAFMLRVAPSAVSVECRTTACRLSFANDVDMSRVQEIMRVAYISNGSVTDLPNRAHYVLYSGTVFDPHGNPEHTIAQIKRRREMNLKAVARRNPLVLRSLKALRPEEFPQP